MMLMQCCSCLKWHLGLWAFFLILTVVSRVCIGNALIGLLGWRRAPPSGQTNSSRYALKLYMTRSMEEVYQKSVISLHLVGLCRFNSVVFVFLHCVSDEPRNQADQHAPEQRSDNCACDNPICRFYTNTNILYL